MSAMTQLHRTRLQQRSLRPFISLIAFNTVLCCSVASFPTRITGSKTCTVAFSNNMNPGAPFKRIEPEEGQESVWDYPRPPRVEPVKENLRVIWNDVEIANSDKAYRVLETSHPPTYYIPKEDIQMQYLKPAPGQSTFCEFKGQASYYSVQVKGKIATNCAWSYPNPTTSRFQPLQDYVSFYAGKIDACYVDGERVQAQEGDFYGGWITSKIVGPFKGPPGTWGW